MGCLRCTHLNTPHALNLGPPCSAAVSPPPFTVSPLPSPIPPLTRTTAACWISNYAHDSFGSSASYVEGWAEVFLFTTMITELAGQSSVNVPKWDCAVFAMLTQMTQTVEMTSKYSDKVHLPYGT